MAFGVEPVANYGDMPNDATLDLRYRLIAEECAELLRAIRERDRVEMLDGMCDLIYVILGLAEVMAIDILPFYEEVHRTNMAKLGPDGMPVLSGAGKVMKPAGWLPPDLQRVLNEERLMAGIAP